MNKELMFSSATGVWATPQDFFDSLGQNVLTAEQWDSLEQHWKAGAKAGVCAGIGNVYAFIPWPVWRSMQEIYGRKFMTAEDLEPYRVRFNGACMFLDPVSPPTAEAVEARDTLGAAKKRLWNKLQKQACAGTFEVSACTAESNRRVRHRPGRRRGRGRRPGRRGAGRRGIGSSSAKEG